MEMYWLTVSIILIWACYILCPYKEISHEAINVSSVAINSGSEFTPYKVLRRSYWPIMLEGDFRVYL